MNKFHSEHSELLPKRSTKKSAGYDFIAPDDYVVPAHSSVVIDTKISVEVDEDLALFLFPRSSYGFKYDVVLANTVGIIDADFYPNVILCKLRNHSDSDLHIKKGDKFAQGIFMQYFKTIDDDADGVRTGGIGSTGK